MCTREVSTDVTYCRTDVFSHWINTRFSTHGTQHLPLNHQEDDHNKRRRFPLSSLEMWALFFFCADNGWKYFGLGVWCGFLFCPLLVFMGNVWSERSAAQNRNRASNKGMERSEETHTSHWWLLTYLHLSSRIWPLILIDIQKMDEHANMLLLSFKVCYTYQPE